MCEAITMDDISVFTILFPMSQLFFDGNIPIQRGR